MAEPRRYVLDTSAVLAFRSDEPGASVVEALLRDRAVTVLVSFMTRMEMLYRVSVDESPDAAATAVRLLDAAGVEWVTCEPAILAEAARIKAAGGLSVADAWIAATAAVRGAVLVHKDPEFRHVRHVLQKEIAR